jgi:hypothetical protein
MRLAVEGGDDNTNPGFTDPVFLAATILTGGGALGARTAVGGIIESRALGIAGEAAAGIIKNTSRIASATRTAAFRVPDALSATTLTEVKNVAKLSLSNQIRDFAAFARATGRGFDLVVRENTKLTAPLREFIKKEGINLKFLP